MRARTTAAAVTSLGQDVTLAEPSQVRGVTLVLFHWRPRPTFGQTLTTGRQRCWGTHLTPRDLVQVLCQKTNNYNTNSVILCEKSANSQILFSRFLKQDGDGKYRTVVGISKLLDISMQIDVQDTKAQLNQLYS